MQEKDGEVAGNEKDSWISYWQPRGESEFGTAIVAPKGTFIGFERYDTDVKDRTMPMHILKLTIIMWFIMLDFAKKKGGNIIAKNNGKII